MRTLEGRILTLLLKHQGKDEAITVKEIKNKIGSDERRIRKAISRLVLRYKCPIASSVHHPYGFYFIADKEEARDCLKQYWSRIAELSKRAKALNQTVRKEFGKDRQGEFNFK